LGNKNDGKKIGKKIWKKTHGKNTLKVPRPQKEQPLAQWD
jgi:hypothetical protein